MMMQNPQRQMPEISRSAWISKTAVIVGNVVIGDNVFVAPNAVIRADEPGSSIAIGSNCNVQDTVVIHALSDSEVVVGINTSLAHGCIVHGPCRIGEGCFIGFGAVIFDCTIGKDTLILHNATVRGSRIPSGKVVPDGQTITRQDAVKGLEEITQDLADFKERVVKTNMDLVKDYRKLAEEA
ncbi:MAG: carbonate dehydratase [Candidatus Methanogaster sp.]|uniref:Carbonate dehydratase n=1 Tax=Candidatus Methanogaster sp. TaxID=3386292 RepID=A0AC61L1N4_9EURY|nr:MAG: carbonate dehydratase [ANME-2 cluster archaeon]